MKFAMLVFAAASLAMGDGVREAADVPAADAVMGVTVRLHDNSVIYGEMQDAEIVSKMFFGTAVTVPLSALKSLTIDKGVDDGGGRYGTFLFKNDDRLTVTLVDAVFCVKTLLGELRLEPSVLSGLTFKPAVPEGLVYACAFESDADLMASAGKIACPEVEFAEGKNGKGVLINGRYDTVVAAIPAEKVNPQAGCIEFWAKINDPSRRFSWSGGHNPHFCQLMNNKHNYHVMINGNNGLGWSGLCANIDGLSQGTSWFGDGYITSYERLLGKDANGWHHYALVWDADGIAGLEKGGKAPCMAIFLDGVLHSSSAECPPEKDEHGASDFTVTLLSSSGGTHPNSYVMDDLKIWNFAKTDFD